jgi:hypothetical protein
MAYASPEENRQYYRFRDERARDWGFRSYREERKYKENNRASIDEAGHSLAWRQSHLEGDYRGNNPKQLVAFKSEILDMANNPYVDDGTRRHAAVAYFIAWEHSSTDEAIAAMRLIYGPS